MCLGDAGVAARLAGNARELNLEGFNLDLKGGAGGLHAMRPLGPKGAPEPFELEERGLESSDESTYDAAEASALSDHSCSAEGSGTEHLRCPRAPRFGPSSDPFGEDELPFLDLDAPAPLPEAPLSEFHAPYAERRLQAQGGEADGARRPSLCSDTASSPEESEGSVSGACTTDEGTSPTSSSCEVAHEVSKALKDRFDLSRSNRVRCTDVLKGGPVTRFESAVLSEHDAVSSAPSECAESVPEVVFVTMQAELEASRMQVATLEEKLAAVQAQSRAEQQRAAQECARLQALVASAHQIDEQLQRHVRQFREEAHEGHGASALQLLAAAVVGGAAVALAALARR